MTESTRRVFLAALAASLLVVGVATAQPLRVQQRVTFQTSELFIESGGQRHRFTVEFADTDERRAMKERGLGTPATRAAIIEKLINEKYLVRENRDLVAHGQGL